MSTSRRLRFVTCGVALAAAAAIAFPAATVAEPAAPPAPLTEAIGKLANAALPDPIALTAAQSIASLDPADLSAAGDLLDLARVDAVAPGDLFGAYQAAVSALRGLGINPFLYPTAAPFCTGAATPLGLAPAMAGTVAGPWPGINVLGQDFNAAKPGETLFAFVPYGVAQGTNTAGMQVAWFNVNTLKGGFVPMGSISDVAQRAIPANLPNEAKGIVQTAITNFLTATVPFGGVRAVPVETGKGTVLAAVFGTVQNGNSSCFFFPTVGITNVN